MKKIYYVTPVTAQSLSQLKDMHSFCVMHEPKSFHVEPIDVNNKAIDMDYPIDAWKITVESKSDVDLLFKMLFNGMQRYLIHAMEVKNDGVN